MLPIRSWVQGKSPHRHRLRMATGQRAGSWRTHCRADRSGVSSATLRAQRPRMVRRPARPSGRTVRHLGDATSALRRARSTSSHGPVDRAPARSSPMIDIDDILRAASVPDLHRASLKDHLEKIRFGTVVRILVVVDSEVSTTPGVGFGIRRVIDEIRAARVGCMRFDVDIARRDALPSRIVAVPDGTGARYTGFRFDMKQVDGVTPVLHQYRQVWCFGFKPDNAGLDDGRILQASAFPASDAELAVLSHWMDHHKGGVFATGDHDYLGASMCHRIPRVRTMRRWTNADGVPPIGGPDRIDTLRPGTEPLGNAVDQEDLTVQPIQWTVWSSIRLGYLRRLARPHPVLCHPTLGPIDVMPDHAHEGLCVDTPDVAAGGSYDFDGSGAQPEYPDAADGSPVRPLVIAYGSTLSGATVNFEKGYQPARARFPMISVYDGHRAQRGRVAVDSTWHHWMNINIDNMAVANGETWSKIRRYFVNLAVWLNPPGTSTRCLFDDLVIAQLGYLGLQEFSPRLTVRELGTGFKRHLVRLYGPCWVTQWLFDWFQLLEPRHRLELFDLEVRPPRGDIPWPPPEPCLSCPPLAAIEDQVLGGIVRATLPWATEMRARLTVGKPLGGDFREQVDKLAADGTGKAMSEFVREWTADHKRIQGLLKPLA
ncbi:hypothetical protein [Leptothrix discophora]|uniref:Uncharacterized protein n=1 Tax=Leptothrix discophora TaxID=89 RepID=A0ABT9FXT2_LEPDI|nr:hypothetical protein [Leptothrix discophora]MDP4299044.1 hypothetical protein [Leptothrix discophora]